MFRLQIMQIHALDKISHWLGVFHLVGLSSKHTYSSNIHVASTSSSKEEVNANPTLHHVACYFFPVGIFCLKQLALTFNTMQIVLVS